MVAFPVWHRFQHQPADSEWPAGENDGFKLELLMFGAGEVGRDQKQSYKEGEYWSYRIMTPNKY